MPHSFERGAFVVFFLKNFYSFGKKLSLFSVQRTETVVFNIYDEKIELCIFSE